MKPLRPWLLAMCALALPAVARGDIFVLHSGGQIEGLLVNPQEKPREKYVIKTSGGEITLRRDQVKEVRRPHPAAAEYAKIRPTFADTADGQWHLAEWCREHKLNDERTRHLERVIELEPDHAKARSALGYAKYDGEWKTQDQVRLERGYVKDKTGRWRLPQQVEEIEKQQELKQAEQEWFSNLKRWRGWLNGDRAEEAQAQIQKIQTPEAVPALKSHLAGEPVEAVRKLYLEALARVGTPEAYRVLTICSLEDESEEIRLSCLDYLEKQTGTGAVELYIQRLRSKDNVMVNRAAVGLQRMKDRRAVRPLIEAIVTEHKFKVSSGSGGGYSTTFTPSGGTFGVGGGPQIVARKLQNPQVLDALVSLAGGANFEYDVRAWKDWFTMQKKVQNFDARRD